MGIPPPIPRLPLPSYARVTNLSNGKSMIVRVNNRGPFVHNRLIDLSVGTAKALGFYGNGIARVRVEYVGRAPIEGSDDRMLLATLREGSPAPRALQGHDRVGQALPAQSGGLQRAWYGCGAAAGRAAVRAWRRCGESRGHENRIGGDQEARQTYCGETGSEIIRWIANRGVGAPGATIGIPFGCTEPVDLLCAHE